MVLVEDFRQSQKHERSDVNQRRCEFTQRQRGRRMIGWKGGMEWNVCASGRNARAYLIWQNIILLLLFRLEF